MDVKAVALSALALLAGCERPAAHAWTWSSDAPSRTGLLEADGDVLLGNEAGALVRLGADGEPRWRTVLGQEIAARPVLVGRTAVAASVGGEWIGVAVEDGAPRWKFTGRPPVTLALAGDAQNAYAVADDGTVLAVSATNGATAWVFARGGADAGERDVPPPRADAPPIRVGDLLVAALSTGVYALAPEDGEPVWRRPIRDVSALVAGGGRVFVATRDGSLRALRVEDGREDWSRPLGGEPLAGATLVERTLWLGLASGELLALHATDGAEAWRTSLPAPLGGGVAVQGDLVLAPTNSPEGRLVALRLGEPRPVFTVRADNALRTAPRWTGNRIVALASDGRVLAWDVRAAAR